MCGTNPLKNLTTKWFYTQLKLELKAKKKFDEMNINKSKIMWKIYLSFLSLI